MENVNIKEFIDNLTEEQRAAVLACNTEEALEQVIEEYDIELTLEMLEGVTGGKGLFQTLVASVVVFTSAASVAANTDTGRTIFASSDIVASADGETIEKIEKQLLNASIDKGLELFSANVPYVGAMLKGPLGNLLKDAFGLTEKPPMTNEELSQQIGELSEKMSAMESSLKEHMDSNTLRLINQINNEATLSTYKNSMNALSVSGNSKLAELAELRTSKDDESGEREYNDDEKLFIIANVIGNSSTWDTSGNIVWYLKEVGGYMMGKNYISEKDFYTALCESGVLQQNCLFYDEVQSAAAPYIEYMMKDYLAAYAITAQSLKAQLTIVDAIDTENTEVFNPNNLRPSLKKLYDNFTSSKTKINATSKELTTIFCGNGEDESPCIVNAYSDFVTCGKTEFINYGKESTRLTLEHKTVTGNADVFTNIYNNNYLTGKDLQAVLNSANSAGMSVADYLKAHNNPLPEGAKYLLVAAGEKDKRERLINYGLFDTNYRDRVYDEITVIDVNDVTQKRQALCVYEHIFARQYGIGWSDFNYDYEYHPTDVVVIKKEFSSTTNPFGNMDEKTKQYNLKSGTYRLGKDYYSNGSIVIGSGIDVTIDLAGYTINRGLDKQDGMGSVIWVKGGGKLTLIDSTGTCSGKITGGYSCVYGGGICVEKNGEAVIEGVTITGNKANEKGAGIFSNGKTEITGCVIENNETGFGGGMYIETDGNVTVKDTHILSNTATGHGGGGIDNHGTLSVEDSTFDGNSGKTNGGALFIGSEYSKLTAKNVVFNNNTADNGAAVYLRGEFYVSSAIFDNCTFTNNKAKSWGGAVYARNEERHKDYILKVDNCYVADNEAGISGGGMFLENSFVEPNITNTVITRNKALGYHGGGIYSKCYTKLTIDGCTISENSAKVDGGGLYFPFYFMDTVGTFVKNSKIENNTSGSGGAGVWIRAKVTLEKCEIAGNHTLINGGGILTHGKLTLKQCNIHDNKADGKGGGLFIGSSMDYKNESNFAYIYGGSISNNESPSGAAIFWRYYNKKNQSYATYDDARIEGSIVHGD